MRITIDAKIRRDKKKEPVDTAAGERVLREAVTLVEDPANSMERLERRRAWLGGAIKMFATMTGADEAEVVKEFAPDVTPAAKRPGGRYADLLEPGVTIEPPPGK